MPYLDNWFRFAEDNFHQRSTSNNMKCHLLRVSKILMVYICNYIITYNKRKKIYPQYSAQSHWRKTNYELAIDNIHNLHISLESRSQTAVVRYSFTINYPHCNSSTPLRLLLSDCFFKQASLNNTSQAHHEKSSLLNRGEHNHVTFCSVSGPILTSSSSAHLQISSGPHSECRTVNWQSS